MSIAYNSPGCKFGSCRIKPGKGFFRVCWMTSCLSSAPSAEDSPMSANCTTPTQTPTASQCAISAWVTFFWALMAQVTPLRSTIVMTLQPLQNPWEQRIWRAAVNEKAFSLTHKSKRGMHYQEVAPNLMLPQKLPGDCLVQPRILSFNETINVSILAIKNFVGMTKDSCDHVA